MRPLHFLLGLAMAATLGAQDAPAPRIGIVVPDRIIGTSARAHKLYSEVEALRKTLDERLKAKDEEVQKISAQLQSPSVSPEAKETLQRQLRDLDFENKKLLDDSQAEFQKVNQRVGAQFQKEIMPLVEALAKEQKLQLVLQWQPGLVAYADETWLLSFSDELAKRYDAKFGTGTSPAPAASATPAPKAPAGVKPAAPKP